MQLFNISLLFRKSKFEMEIPKSIIVVGLLAMLTILISPTCKGAVVLNDADAGAIKAGSSIGFCCWHRACSWDECASDKEREDACIFCNNYDDSTWRIKDETIPSNPVHECHLDADEGDCGAMCKGTCTNGVCNGTVPLEDARCSKLKKDNNPIQYDCSGTE